MELFGVDLHLGCGLFKDVPMGMLSGPMRAKGFLRGLLGLFSDNLWYARSALPSALAAELRAHDGDCGVQPVVCCSGVSG